MKPYVHNPLPQLKYLNMPSKNTVVVNTDQECELDELHGIYAILLDFGASKHSRAIFKLQPNFFEHGCRGFAAASATTKPRD